VDLSALVDRPNASGGQKKRTL